VLVQSSVGEFRSNFRRFDFELQNDEPVLKKEPFIVNIERVKNKVELYTYSSESDVMRYLEDNQITVSNFAQVTMELEDAFIGLTGKY
jgi:ABC-2 type transport system ATP-binding protein